MLRTFLPVAARCARQYSGGHIGGNKKLTALDKRIMVFSGAYKNASEVPDVVPPAQYTKAREKFRIKLNILAIFTTLVACGYMISVGQRDSEDGKSYHNKVLEEHANLQKGGVTKSNQ